MPRKPVKSDKPAAKAKRTRNAVFVTLDDATEAALRAYVAGYEVAPDRAAVTLHALREFLTKRGHYPPKP